MDNKMNAGDVLFCKLDENRLEVTAFSHNGGIVARKLHIEWNGCVFEVPFGCEEFKSENDVEECVKDKLMPFLKGLLPRLASELSSVNMGIMIVPISIQGETTRNNGSAIFVRPVEQ